MDVRQIVGWLQRGCPGGWLVLVLASAVVVPAKVAPAQLIAGSVTVIDPYPYWGWGPGNVYVGPWAQPWPIFVPPLVIPAETIYGPAAIQRFMGVNVPFQPPRTTIVVNRPNLAAADAPPKAKTSNAAARERAVKFMQFGDAQFANQRYHSAVERYKSAVEAAADLPEAHFRLGFGLVAMGRYDAAARTLRRGLLLADGPKQPGFTLEELYQGNRAAKLAHLEALAQAIEAAPQTADLLLTLAMLLHFDGQPDKAEPLFTRCAQLGGNEDGALDGLLPDR